MQNKLRIIFLGDLVGQPGRAMFEKWARRTKEKYKADAMIVNGENSADNGRGITPQIASFFLSHGADAITTGNHVWAHKNVHEHLNDNDKLLRPANFPHTCPGKGYTFINVNGHQVAVVSLQGRVFMHDLIDCPFRTIESMMPLLNSKTKTVFVDFHAEATSEKQGMGFFLDGKVTGVFGTHTHVQTADERVLPKGTAYITDLGFAGSMNSMLGMRKEAIIEKLVKQMPVRFSVELKDRKSVV